MVHGFFYLDSTESSLCKSIAIGMSMSVFGSAMVFGRFQTNSLYCGTMQALKVLDGFRLALAVGECIRVT
ncbi:hypothetical protein D3C78_1933280 [compost metagenome]